jgi:uncharacterized protein
MDDKSHRSAERRASFGITDRACVDAPEGALCARGSTQVERSDAEALRAISEKARRVFWLNPEPEVEWGVTDSAMDDYRAYCRGAFEVRSLRQLGDVIASLV